MTGISTFLKESPVDVSFRSTLRRWLVCIVAGPCLLAATGAVHAAATDVRDAVAPPALLGTIGCSHTRATLVQEFAGQMNMTRRGRAGNYSPQQVREIMNGVDETIEQFCRLLAVKTAATQRANLAFMTENAQWKATLADPAAVAWLRTNSQFLAEIESLYILFQLGDRLYPGNAENTSLQRTPALLKLMDETKFYAFTDEESAARSLLAMPDKRAYLAAVLPVRFDVGRLAQLEAATRAAGTPFLRRYRFDMPRADTAKSRTLRALSPAEEQELEVAMNTAVARLKAIAQRYAPAAAGRGK